MTINAIDKSRRRDLSKWDLYAICGADDDRSAFDPRFMAASIGCLGLALRSLPIGTAYAVWTGTSIAGAAAMGIYLFDEPTTMLRLISIGLIVLGVVGLRLES